MQFHKFLELEIKALHIHSHIYYYYYYSFTAHCWALASFLSFLSLYTVGKAPRMEDQPVARPLPKQRTTQTE
jgi:hypothetical protein